MNTIPIRDVCFDDKATLAMGAAFDQACNFLGYFAHDVVVREFIAKRIVGAASNGGEVDQIRLQSQALVGFSIDDVSVPVASVGRPPSLPTLWLRTQRDQRARLVSPLAGLMPSRF